VRHAAVLGFGIDGKTLARMRESAPHLVRIAPERVRSELALLFAVDPVTPGLEMLQAAGLIPVLFGPTPVSAFAAGMALAARAGEAIRALDGESAEEEIEGGLTRAALVKLAAFLRGCGGDPTNIAARLRLGRQATAALTSLARLGPEQGRTLELQPLTSRGRALRASRLGTDPATALALLAALAEGTVAPAVLRLQPYLAAWRQEAPEGRIPDLVDGDWVREHLGLAEGPDIGAALAAVRDAELAGQVTSAEEARHFLVAWTGNKGREY
jgi:poly(A) polymerase